MALPTFMLLYPSMILLLAHHQALCYCSLYSKARLSCEKQESGSWDYEGCPVMPTDVHWDLGLPLYYPISCCHCAKRPYCPSHPTVLWDEMDGLGSYQGVPLATPCPYCPSHPTVPWDRVDGLGSYQSIPLATLCPYCMSIPSHCTMGRNGQTLLRIGNVTFVFGETVIIIIILYNRDIKHRCIF